MSLMTAIVELAVYPTKLLSSELRRIFYQAKTMKVVLLSQIH
jgi:hypothetical protein